LKYFLVFLIPLLALSIISVAQIVTDSTTIRKNDSAADVLKPLDSIKKKVIKKKPPIPQILVRQKVPDTIRKRLPDTIPISANRKSIPERDVFTFKEILSKNPYFNFFGPSLTLAVQERKTNNKEPIFYLVLGVLYYFALIKLFFGKYVNNLITLFFRVTMKQQQLREQLIQDALPSLLLNILFIISGGLYIAFLAKYFGILPNFGMWWIFLYSMILLASVYIVKYMVLKVTGWVFNVKAATDTYIFIVFLVNKMIGIFLLPALVFLALPHPFLVPVVLTLSFILLLGLFTYRFLISYRPIRKEINVNVFHFFLYLCAFEIAPLLLIYKVLLIFVERSS
jgi:uncharacterized protein DUF4271